MNTKQEFVLRKAIDKWGIERQKDKLIEEMAELTKAILKHRHCAEDYLNSDECLKNIHEEIADVEILLDQIKSLRIYNCRNEVSRVTDFKISRLEGILDKV